MIYTLEVKHGSPENQLLETEIPNLGNHHFQVPCSTLRGYVKDIPTTNGQSLIFGLPKSGKL